jgi:hypothetical protein
LEQQQGLVNYLVVIIILPVVEVVPLTLLVLLEV